MVETGGRPSRLTASSARDPTASRPPFHHDRLVRHRDPYAAAYRSGKMGDVSGYNKSRWLWVPAFAGTTCSYTFAGVSCTDSPQPQAETWFGLLKMNWACSLSAL